MFSQGVGFFLFEGVCFFPFLLLLNPYQLVVKSKLFVFLCYNNPAKGQREEDEML